MNSIIETLNQFGGQFLSFAWPMLWQSSLLITALLAIDLLLGRKLRASIRYALWLVVLVKLCVPPTLALPTSPAWWLRKTPPPVVAKSLPHYTVTYDNGPLLEIPQTMLAAAAPPKPAMTNAAWLLAASAACSSVLLLWLLVRWWQITRLVRHAEISQRLTSVSDETQRCAGMRLKVQVKLTANTMSPAVCGLFHPTILIPQSLAENFSDEQLRAVLLHELIHLRRRDVWVNFLQALLQIVYWWHPLAWLANARIRRAREEAVDDAVMLALRDESESYAPTLLEVAKIALNRPLVSLGLVGIMESRHALRQRIERLVDFCPPRQAGLTLVSLIGILAFTVVAVPMGDGPSPEEKPVLPASAVSKPPDAIQITNQPAIVIQAEFYQMRPADFKSLVSGLRHHEGGVNEDAWWLASPEQFSRLQKDLKQSGLEPLLRPRIQTGDGIPAQMYVGDGTNGLRFECTPMVKDKAVDLAVSGKVVDGEQTVISTNQFRASASMENAGSMVIRVDNLNGLAMSNLVAVIGLRIVTNTAHFQQRLPAVIKQGSLSQTETSALADATKTAISDLEKRLGSADERTRANGLAEFAFSPVTISEAENPAIDAALPILIQATKDKNSFVRAHAVNALHRIKSTNQNVVKALGHLATIETDLGIAVIAVSALKKIGPASAPAVPDLIQILEQRKPDGTFIFLTNDQIQPNTPLGTALRRAAIEALGNIGSPAQDAVPLLRKLLYSTGEFPFGDHVFSAKALWQITGETNESLPVLINALEKDDIFLAADVLGMMGVDAKPAIPALERALQSRIGYTRLRSVIALNEVEPGYQLPMPLLLALLKDASSATRFEAAQLIWETSHDSQLILPVLLGLIQQKEPTAFGMDFYGEKAIALLGEIGSPAEAAVPRLKEIIKEKRSSHVAKLAETASGKIESATNRINATTNSISSSMVDSGQLRQEEFSHVVPQIHIKARFLEVPKGTVAGFGNLLNSTNSAAGEFTGILSDTNARAVLHSLRLRKNVEILAEPEAVTISGRQTQMRATVVSMMVTNFVFGQNLTNSWIEPQMGPMETGSVLDVVPDVLVDGITIDLKTKASQTEFWGYAFIPTNAPLHSVTNFAGEEIDLPLSWPAMQISRATADVSLHDGQTFLLALNSLEQIRFAEPDEKREAVVAKHIRDGQKKNKGGEREIIVFITATLVDPAGNRIHADGAVPGYYDDVGAPKTQ